MWPFRTKAPRPPSTWAGPSAFYDWTEDDISAMSQAIRTNGQPESDGFRVIARVALNTLRGGSAVELVARAIEETLNSGHDPDAPIDSRTGHYLAGWPRWCGWAEYARPAVEHWAKARQR
jgi:hypothetical protein